MYTSKLTTIASFSQNFILHMPPKPIASAGSDISIIFLCKK